MSAPRRSLAGAFAPPPASTTTGDRSAGLLELLPTRPGPAPTTPPAAETPARWAVAHCAPLPIASLDQPGSARDVVRSVAVYLPPDLHERLRRTARVEDLTYADLLVRAADHLATISSSFAAPAPAPTGNGMPVRARPARPVPGIQTQFRLDGHQLDWLDTQTRRLRAPSRSALVVALLDAALPAPETPA